MVCYVLPVRDFLRDFHWHPLSGIFVSSKSSGTNAKNVKSSNSSDNLFDCFKTSLKRNGSVCIIAIVMGLKMYVC